MIHPRLPCAAWALLCAGTAAASPQLLYDRARPGHGLDLHQAGSTLFGTLYTYDASGAPQWLWLQTEAASTVQGRLTRFTRTPDGMLRAADAGHFSLQPALAADCADGQPRPAARALQRLRFELDGQPRDWCVEALLPATAVPAALLSGAWYAPGDPGWGLLAHYYAAPDGAPQAYQTVYFHDAQGQPRWAFGQGPAPQFRLQQEFFVQQADCAGCAVGPGSARSVGQASIELRSTQPQPAAPNQVELRLDYGQDSRFERRAVLQLLSDPTPVADAASTREGVVQGLVDADGLRQFRAIPYLAPPLGELRWRAPQAAAARAAVLEVQQYGPGCPQRLGQGFFGSAGPAQVAEDCLQLNIWSPPAALQPGARLPVMVWLHGGGLLQGSAVDQVSGQLLYDGAAFARHDAVFVSLNYRLGALGYAALREFAGLDAEQPAAGNYGLLDQLAGLRWVRDNIAAFGGDPDRVTVFGESAGAVSTCALLATPAARGLFSAAIMQSGNCLKNVPGLPAAYAQGDQLVAASGCAAAPDRRACLRALPAERVVELANASIGFARDGEDYGLLVDGFVLPETPAAAVASGRAAAVPLLLGVNDDETTTLLPASTLPRSAAAYEAQVRALVPQAAVATAVLARYPASAYASPAQAWQDLYDDLAFTCANRRAAADHASRGNPVYHYALTEILPDQAALESYHGLDIPLLFGIRPQALPAERALGNAMRAAWLQFARSGAPGSAAGPAWPRHDAAQRLGLRFDSAAGGPIADYRGSYCAFWDAFVQL